ncbi:hypothetical protein ACOSQ2_016735 [Xanthoceras sorbifolium]
MVRAELMEEENIRKGKQQIGGEIMGAVKKQSETTGDLGINSMRGDFLTGHGSIIEKDSPSILDHSEKQPCMEPKLVVHITDQQSEFYEVANNRDSKDKEQSKTNNTLSLGNKMADTKQSKDSAAEIGAKIFVFGGSNDAGKRSTWKRRARGFNDTQSMEVENLQSRKRIGDSKIFRLEEGQKKQKIISAGLDIQACNIPNFG